VKHEEIVMRRVVTDNNTSDMLTKIQTTPLFLTHRSRVLKSSKSSK
jgi:hypothetical protein